MLELIFAHCQAASAIHWCKGPYLKLSFYSSAVPCARCAGGVGKVQGFEDVLQQCACQRDRGSITVLQTGREPVIH